MRKISIITPSLNSAEVVSDCIRSVAEQADGIEHLVIDGNSADNTVQVIKDAGGQVRMIQAPPEGIYAALNKGILETTGEIVGILHADDFYASPIVLKQVAAAFDDSSVDACYGDLSYVDQLDTKSVVRYWRAGQFEPGKFLHGWMPPHPTFFVRRRVYENFGLYRTDLGTSADYEFMLRVLFKHQVKVMYIPQVLVHMRTGGSSNATWRARIEANRMDRKAWKVNGLHSYPWTTIAKPLRKIGQWWSRP